MFNSKLLVMTILMTILGRRICSGKLQARLSEMLCDDSFKASAALQDFLGLQAPERLGKPKRPRDVMRWWLHSWFIHGLLMFIDVY